MKNYRTAMVRDDSFEDLNPYVEIIKDMESRLVIGPHEQYRDETHEQFEIRKGIFERCARGMLRMCEHQLGLREVRLRK